MNQTHRFAAVVAALCLLLPVVSGCVSDASAAEGPIAVAGATRADSVVIAAPTLSQPALDVTVGIAKFQTPALIAARRKAAAAAARARGPVVSGRLTEVKVRPGDMVKKGQVLAAFDDKMLLVGVESAQAAYRRSVATADTMRATASTVRDQRSKVYTARRTLRQQQALLGTSKTKLAAQLAQLQTAAPSMRAGLAQLMPLRAQTAANLAKAEAAAHSPNPPPGAAALVAQLRKNLAILDGKIAGAKAGLAAIPKLQAALGKMAVGQAAMAAAKAKIASGLSQMADAIGQLENASDTIRIAAGAQAAGEKLAKYAADQAVLRAPVDGLVIQSVQPGQVVMVGAPVVTIRPTGDVLVDVYLSPEQAARVKVGDRADVTVDSLKGSLAGRVSVVGTTVEFPPANYPTPIVHLASTVRVTVAVPDARLPVGVPADVVIHPSK